MQPRVVLSGCLCLHHTFNSYCFLAIKTLSHMSFLYILYTVVDHLSVGYVFRALNAFLMIFHFVRYCPTLEQHRCWGLKRRKGVQVWPCSTGHLIAILFLLSYSIHKFHDLEFYTHIQVVSNYSYIF